MRIFNKIPSLYKMKGEKVSYWSDKWLEVFLYENGSYYYDTAGYFEIEGKPRKIEVTSKKIDYEESLQKWNISTSDRLCCVIKFKDRTTPFRVFLNQYDKFQAYLT
ncbi:hypothetical protein AB6C69_24545, partial [Vibrio splendidus]